MSNQPVFHDLTQEQQNEGVCFIIEVLGHMYEVKWDSDGVDDFILICDGDVKIAGGIVDMLDYLSSELR